MSLRRGDLAADDFEDALRQLQPGAGFQFVPAEAREASLQATLAAAPPGDLWLFGYGSLMWAPAIEHQGSAAGLLRGWHRRFCLWTHLGRGTIEAPGLVLGLERGGACRGLAFRIARDRAEEELRLVWRREMLTGGYCPRWVSIETPEGPIRAVTFVINRDGARYAGRLCDERTAATIAGAEGHLGSCRDYLEEAIRALDMLGIRDRYLDRLRRKVAACAVADPRHP
ncbi:gamma-glutamylcyclotransferase [Zavarzinia compransoris]|uniref:glutathione-specific gamma-glutamylcyclotransferase n=1 Tax=Zavarzinia compransoris TaxID=1264899 RepID=A0A317E052_9PROT|nr:gamma-glutamylcyclotransferase [Zavarzinia compransoris]PWR20011.1 gamma-glutamylcyclotransferase [Zavarzinia compransoris]TDP44870.1 cation transport protein ChaC [Zavarzinia compransoris]